MAHKHAAAPRDERPEYPKPLVRLKPVPGGYDAEVRMVGDGDAAAAAEAAGFQPVMAPEQSPDFQEYPKWVFHEDGRRTVVSNEAELAELEGFTSAPPTPPEIDPYEGQVPPPGDTVTQPTSTRGPVPVDRG